MRSILRESVRQTSGFSKSSWCTKPQVWPEGSADDFAKTAVIHSSWNTDQGVYDIYESAGAKTHRRNESEYKQPLRATGCSCSRPWSSEKGSSKSISHKTRKMVNYTWVGWSLRKLRWKLEEVLTCKSISKLEYRGDRLIELSSSWFTLKFLSG